MNKTKCTSCRHCEHCSLVPAIQGNPVNKWKNAQCNHPSIMPCTIQHYVGETEKLDPPTWCPMGYAERHKPKTVYEIRQYIAKLTPTVEWENIEVGEIYHLPPIGTQKRVNIFIIERSHYLLRFKELTNLETGTGFTRVIYKASDDDWRIMAKYRGSDLTKLKEKLQKEMKDTNMGYSFH